MGKLTPHGIDHVVVAVADLDAAGQTFANLGFTVTPKSHHPFGTVNSVIQFANAFIELVSIENGGAILEGSRVHFSYGAFIRDALAKREGPVMLARKSQNCAADLELFDNAGMETFNPSGFEHEWVGPDGVSRTIGVSTAHVHHPDLSDISFLTCHHHDPENFRFPEYRRHENGAARLHSAVIVAPDPADYHEFLTFFTGQHDIRSNSLGVEFDLHESEVDVFTPVAYRGLFGEDPTSAVGRLAAIRIAVDDLDAVKALLKSRDLHHVDIGGAAVIPSAHAHGMAIGFVAGP